MLTQLEDTSSPLAIAFSRKSRRGRRRRLHVNYSNCHVFVASERSAVVSSSLYQSNATFLFIKFAFILKH